MATNTTVAQEIERAERTLDLWHRVCSEAQEKPWSEIDNGLRDAANWSGDFWEAYMRQRMYHHLHSIVLASKAGG